MRFSMVRTPEIAISILAQPDLRTFGEGSPSVDDLTEGDSDYARSSRSKCWKVNCARLRRQISRILARMQVLIQKMEGSLPGTYSHTDYTVEYSQLHSQVVALGEKLAECCS